MLSLHRTFMQAVHGSSL